MIFKRGKSLFFISVLVFSLSMCAHYARELIEEHDAQDMMHTVPAHPFFDGHSTDTQDEVSGTEAEETVLFSPYASFSSLKEEGLSCLAGNDEGLFAIGTSGKLAPLWTGGSVSKILPLQTDELPPEWLLLTSEGILYSGDLENWEFRNRGLPEKTIKEFINGEKSFFNMTQQLKDLEVNPRDPNIIVTATNNRVYLSRDQGLSWTALPELFRSNGIKAVATAFLPGQGGGELVVFASHGMYGMNYILPDSSNARWNTLYGGLERMETAFYPDEVSDIAVVNVSNSSVQEVYVSQTFRKRIYRLNWDGKTFNLIWSDEKPFGTVDSLSPGVSVLNFLSEGMVSSIDFSSHILDEKPHLARIIGSITEIRPPNTVFFFNEKLSLHELWLLDAAVPGQAAFSPEITAGREGVFMPTDHALNAATLQSYYDLFERTGVNMIVTDMKDENGRLRFTPANPALERMGTIFRPVDIDSFLSGMKERGIYTVARIVVFKDRELFFKEDGRYAVWDSRNGRPWTGTGFNEHWLDPYSHEVWEYIAMICEELHERGFDEIQFDYIRFPTDGSNLGDAYYRWQDPGMDMESAIYSFLRHIRSRVNVPVSIDIYGTNGWYRTGGLTGQEVELLSPLVDVICPMYYPSHWEQYFLAQAPAQLRPWRIYYYGTLRTQRISRGRNIIRPWAQAMFFDVSYDRQYYNTDYVRRQIEGVREAGNGGFTFWNSSGNYSDVPDLSAR